MTKACVKCERTLPIDSFAPGKGYADGRRTDCRDCRRAYKSAWRAANPERVRGYMDRYRAKAGLLPIGEASRLKAAARLEREKAAESARKKKAEAKAKALTAKSKVCPWCERKLSRKAFSLMSGTPDGREYICRACRRDARRERVESMTQAEKAAFYARRVREIGRQRGVVEDITGEDVERLFAIYGGKCFSCKTTEGLTLDHHVPVSRGRPLLPGNAVVLCMPCNARKGARDPEEFYDDVELARLAELLDAARSGSFPRGVGVIGC